MGKPPFNNLSNTKPAIPGEIDTKRSPKTVGFVGGKSPPSSSGKRSPTKPLTNPMFKEDLHMYNSSAGVGEGDEMPTTGRTQFNSAAVKDEQELK